MWGRSEAKGASLIIEKRKTVEEKEEVSSDEELEEAYANLEVNFDESETEEEEEEQEVPQASAAIIANNDVNQIYASQSSLNFPNTTTENMFASKVPRKGLSLQILDPEAEFANSVDVPELEMYSPDILDAEEDDYEPQPTLEEVTVSQGKSFLLDFEPLLVQGGGGHVDEAVVEEEEEEEVDIDLTDPALEAAATKIQSVFKGFRARKSMQQKSLQM